MNNQSLFLESIKLFITEYLPTAKGASPNTIRSYKYTFKLLFKFMEQFGKSPDKIAFSDFSVEIFEKFFQWILNERKCSLSTKNQRHAALLSFSEYAQNHNFDAALSFRTNLLKIPLKKAQKKLRSYFTPEEVHILLALPNLDTYFGFRNQVIMSLMYASGARAQEICDLKVKDFNTDFNNKSTLSLTGKGNKTRKVFISGKSASLLSEYIRKNKLEGKLDKYIFSSLTHEHCTISCIEEIFRKYISEAREKYPNLFLGTNYSPHSMRHSTASHMLEAGVPLIVIKNFLGHASLASTQVYAELSQGAVDDAVKQWNKQWFSSELEKEIPKNNEILDFLED